MKRKQRILAVVLLCSALIVMGIINIYGENEAFEYFTTVPTDIGNKITLIPNTNELKKYYIKISITNTNIQCDIKYQTSPINNPNNYSNYRIISNYARQLRTFQNGPISGNPYIIMMPYIVANASYTFINKTYYIPIYVLNNEISIYQSIDCTVEIYESTTIDPEQIQNEYYTLGYQNGYNTGYEEGYPQGFNEAQGIKQDLNIVEHIEQLIAQFTGNEYAKYITPIALVLTILMIYFLFIRFILSLMKAKGIIKTCDILMIVACIIILVAMYMPMINLEITQHQIIEQVETTSGDVYTVNSDITYYTYTDEQGNTIHGGPVGTWIETIETTTE